MWRGSVISNSYHGAPLRELINLHTGNVPAVMVTDTESKIRNLRSLVFPRMSVRRDISLLQVLLRNQMYDFIRSCRLLILGIIRSLYYLLYIHRFARSPYHESLWNGNFHIKVCHFVVELSQSVVRMNVPSVYVVIHSYLRIPLSQKKSSAVNGAHPY